MEDLQTQSSMKLYERFFKDYEFDSFTKTIVTNDQVVQTINK